LETETTFPATVEGLRDAAREVGEIATSVEAVPGGDGGKYLPEVPTGDQGDVGMPPAEDDGLSLKNAARRLAEHRQQREADRDKLNKAIGLDDEPQQQQPWTAADNEAEREKWLSEQRVPDAIREEVKRQMRERDDAEPAAQSHVEQTIRHNAEASRQQILGAYLQQVPEAANPQAWAAMEAQNPARAQAARQLYAQYEGVYRQHLNDVAQAVPLHLEWRRAQDALFDHEHPEMKDPKVKGEIRDAAVRVLKKAGATDADIDQLRANGLPFVAQEMLAKAAKYELALEARAKNAGRRVPPAPQRPGVAGAPMSRAGTAAHAASRAMDQNPSVKNAARMLAAMRRAR
jgi:hypothetical protein